MKRLLTICIVLAIYGTAQAAPVTCTDCTDGTTTGEEAVLIESVLPPSVPLSEVLRTWVEGDYVAAGAGLRDSASGTITISLPAGAVVQKAFLYWSIMENSSTPSADLYNVTFNGNAVTGALVGTAGDPCWLLSLIHNFVADVTGLETDGGNSVTLASTPAGILREGASLVVIFDDPATPGVYREVIIQQGAVTFAGPPTESTTLSGFSAAGASATTTFIIADGQDNTTPTSISDDSGVIDAAALVGDTPPTNNYWDTDTYTVTDASDDSVTLGILSGMDCLTWVAQVLSVEVDPTTVSVDIKPRSCPNPFNVKSKGVLPVAILGTAEFDVEQVNIASIELVGVEIIAGSNEVNDVATPVTNPEGCNCTEDGPDGLNDLVFNFKTQEILEAIEDTIGPVVDGNPVVLTLTAELLDGTPIQGQDCILIRKKVKPE